mmetsp:Transcript_20828/g.51245  ORF Transcript_20828/g.51245 Transcript_20828/m.51245 type:complete len:86 (-) Transcript_20828:222-479(-)
MPGSERQLGGCEVMPTARWCTPAQHATHRTATSHELQPAAMFDGCQLSSSPAAPLTGECSANGRARCGQVQAVMALWLRVRGSAA